MRRSIMVGGHSRVRAGSQLGCTLQVELQLEGPLPMRGSELGCVSDVGSVWFRVSD